MEDEQCGGKSTPQKLLSRSSETSATTTLHTQQACTTAYTTTHATISTTSQKI